MFAAMLQRDAGCVALFRDDVTTGRSHLMAAGEDIGQFDKVGGAALVALASTRDQRERAINLWNVARDRLIRFTEGDEQYRVRRFWLTPRLILSAAQAALLVHARFGDRDEFATWLEPLLADGASDAPAGRTGLTVGAYVELGISATVENFAGAGGAEWMEAMWVRRRRDIQVAKRDRYHWRLLPCPSELLELDSVILLAIHLLSGGQADMSRAPEETSDVVFAPLTTARWLLE